MCVFQLDLAVVQSENKIMCLIESRLTEHKDAIDKRLDNQDDKLDTMQQDLSALVGTDKVQDLIARNTILLQTLIDHHAQDAIFQAAITTQVSNLTTAQAEQGKDIHTVRWFIWLCSMMGKLGRWALKAITDSGVFAQAVGIGLLWLAGWHWHALIAWLHSR